MKIAFFWTPQFAADILAGLLKYQEIEIKLVVSQPDMPVWRKQLLQSTPVKQKALDAGISVLQPETLKGNDTFFSFLESLSLDFFVVVAYGKIIPGRFLKLPEKGAINLHGSILPKYRGASPIQTALLHGESETGLTTMYMSEKMDEGDILKVQKINIDIVDTSEDIFAKCVDVGPVLLYETLQDILLWRQSPSVQNHSEATYCHKIEKQDGHISFQSMTSKTIYNKYRAFTPWPWIFGFVDGKRIMFESLSLSEIPWDEYSLGECVKLWKNRYGIVCADSNILELAFIQMEGKKVMDIQSFINGNPKILWARFE